MGVWGDAGAIYLSAALILGAVFLYYAVRLWRDASVRASSALFRYSILYLSLLFAALMIDHYLPLLAG